MYFSIVSQSVTVKVGRTGTYIVTVLGAVAAIVTAAASNEDTSIFFFFGMLALDFLVGLICGFVIKRGPPAMPTSMELGASVNDDVDDDDNDDDQADKRSGDDASRNAVCTTCGVRPVQVRLRKGDGDDTHVVETCRQCVKGKAKTLNATFR